MPLQIPSEVYRRCSVDFWTDITVLPGVTNKGIEPLELTVATVDAIRKAAEPFMDKARKIREPYMKLWANEGPAGKFVGVGSNRFVLGLFAPGIEVYRDVWFHELIEDLLGEEHDESIMPRYRTSSNVRLKGPAVLNLARSFLSLPPHPDALDMVMATVSIFDRSGSFRANRYTSYFGDLQTVDAEERVHSSELVVGPERGCVSQGSLVEIGGSLESSPFKRPVKHAAFVSLRSPTGLQDLTVNCHLVSPGSESYDFEVEGALSAFMLERLIIPVVAMICGSILSS